MKRIPLACLLFALACKQPASNTIAETENTSVKDPHSFAQTDKAIVKHLNLHLNVDFDNQQLSGKAIWDIENIAKGTEIILDVNTLTVTKVTLNDEETEAKFSLDSSVPFMGQALHITITPQTKKLTVYYYTSKDATAVQWLTAAQTAGKKWPFLFTQSEAILARTWVPCQDGPAVRFTYDATITVPKELMAVMSAENPQQKNAEGVYQFKQTHAIPSYLLALAVGDLSFKAIDNRTGIYAEPSVVEKAAWEFAEMGKMVDEAEKLYGPYRWGRYDVLVLPPSFPFGGMENPNLTFATPTVIAGDRSLTSLIAHELAHSWSGNLVTNATWNDMWLNEGFTVYFERRIVEAVYGKNEADMQTVLGDQSLAEAIETKGDTSKDTKLKGDYIGRDPDEATNDIPYDKGFAFLRTIEEAVGREKWDSFLKSWFDKNAFQSRNTEQFISYLNSNLIKGDTALANKIRVNDWVYKPGVPNNMIVTSSSSFKAIDTLLMNLKSTDYTQGFNTRSFSSNEGLYYISHLPDNITATNMASIDKNYHFTQSGNAEIQAAWYKLAVAHQYKPAYANLEKFLLNVGRRKFIVPIYKELVKTPEGKVWAKQIFDKAKTGYHPLAVGTISALVQ
jgi:leukotriene-A4 hydrolase